LSYTANNTQDSDLNNTGLKDGKIYAIPKNFINILQKYLKHKDTLS